MITGKNSTYLALACSALVGAILGLLLPRFTIRKEDRLRIDLLYGMLTGAAIAGTIWATVLVFVFWLRLRSPQQISRRRSYYVIIPSFAACHFLVIFGICCGLMSWINTYG